MRRTFTFDRAALADESSEEAQTFVLAVTDGGYYKIDRTILGLKHDLRLWKSMSLSHQSFIAQRDISVFAKVDDLVEEPIVAGGDADDSISLDDFEKLLKNFPTSTELTHYARARVSSVLKDYLGTMSDAQRKLDVYLNRKRTIPAPSRITFLKDYELLKHEYVRDELSRMLNEAETYSERDWQKLMVGFLLLTFPKYIAVLENLQIKDFYSDPLKIKDRYVDLTLVDANGTLDIIEIKKPLTIACCRARNTGITSRLVPNCLVL